MVIIETKVQLHYRYLNLTFGVVVLYGILLYLFCNYSSQNQLFNLITCLITTALLFAGGLMMIKKLTKNIVFSFGEKFSIQITDPKTNVLQEEHQFNYEDIKSCQLSSGSVNTCTLKINLSRGDSFKMILYSEAGDFTEAKKIVGFKVFEQLHRIDPRIAANKPLLATKVGIGAIIFLLILFVTNILVHIVTGETRTLLIGLPISLGMMLPILGMRRKQLSLYYEMMALS